MKIQNSVPSIGRTYDSNDDDDEEDGDASSSSANEMFAWYSFRHSWRKGGVVLDMRVVIPVGEGLV